MRPLSIEQQRELVEMIQSEDIELIILAFSIIGSSSGTWHWMGVSNVRYYKIPFYKYVQEVALEIFCKLDYITRSKYDVYF